MGFNHASCGCVFPEFEINECIGLQSYPVLRNIDIVFEEVQGEMFAWTGYGGIVAL